MSEDVPDSVRIRTGGENEYRYRSIQRAREIYDRNKSDTVAYACEDVVGLVEALEQIFSRNDLTRQQLTEMVKTVNRETSGLDVEIEDVEVEIS